MSKRQVEEVLGSLDRPAQPRPEFTEALSHRLMTEFAVEADPRRESLAVRIFGRPGARLRRLVPVGAVVALLAALLVWNVSRPESAFAVAERAIAKFSEIPPFRAVIVGPRGEVTVARLELLYRGKDAWRLELIEVTPVSYVTPGDFEVWDGTRYYIYRAVDNTYTSSTNIGEGFSPLGLLSWESHGGIGFWRERCGKAESRVLGGGQVAGRSAQHIRCADLDLWIDAETGLILRIKSLERASAAPRPVPGPIGLLPGTTVEITEIEYNPSFPEGAFEFVPPSGATESQGEPEPPPSRLMKIGDLSPRWGGELLSGGSFGTESLRGRPAVVFFWAPWCVPCLKDPMTQFRGAYRHHRGALGLVSVSYDKREPTQELVNKNSLEFPVVLDEKGAVSEGWGLAGIPTLVLLDSGGRVLGIYYGLLSNQDFDRLIDAFVQGRPLPNVSPQA